MIRERLRRALEATGVVAFVAAAGWAAVSRLFVPLDPSRCPDLHTTGLVIGVGAGLEILAIGSSILAATLRGVRRGQIVLLVIGQVLVYAILGLWEYLEYGGLCGLTF